MADALTVIRSNVRYGAEKAGAGLHRLSKGRLTPDMITVFGLAMHLPTAWFIASGHFLWAAGFLVVFGLFDVLDGGLARAQGKSSLRGMLLDASTDRMKEVLLYSGAAYWLALHATPAAAAWATAACGASICVSYVKAKGEAAVASGSRKIPHATLNRMFADGLLTFEMRMAVLVAGLLFDRLAWAVLVVAVLAGFTAVQRLVRISRQL
jgi:archaetidylinositol phosphate synthase